MLCAGVACCAAERGVVLLVLLCLGALLTLDTVWKESSSTPLL